MKKEIITVKLFKAGLWYEGQVDGLVHKGLALHKVHNGFYWIVHLKTQLVISVHYLFIKQATKWIKEVAEICDWEKEDVTKERIEKINQIYERITSSAHR